MRQNPYLSRVERVIAQSIPKVLRMVKTPGSLTRRIFTAEAYFFYCKYENLFKMKTKHDPAILQPFTPSNELKNRVRNSHGATPLTEFNRMITNKGIKKLECKIFIASERNYPIHEDCNMTNAKTRFKITILLYFGLLINCLKN
jgi:hypothetical protein